MLQVTQQDMVETFIRPFETCVREGDSSSIMCSFNRINGIPVCADPQLMSQTFRDDWQLHGYAHTHTYKLTHARILIIMIKPKFIHATISFAFLVTLFPTATLSRSSMSARSGSTAHRRRPLPAL